jgi:hypothetical protein
MSAATVYKLKHPLELRNAAGEVTETITELQLHRLKGKDMRAMDSAKGNGSAMLAMVAASARIPPSTVDLMDGEDVTDAGMVVAGFLGGFLATGEKS